MAYVKNPTDKQRVEWAKAAEQQEKKMSALVTNLAESYQERPENIAELLSFGSKFYQYSVRNNMLLYSQNPHLTYVQSYKAWKEMGYAPQRGEHGLKVYVPVQATILKIGNELVPLEQATDEQKIQYRAGEIESITKTKFHLGTVFDISQTTFPKENYPQLFQMGYPSEKHRELLNGLIDFSKQSLGCSVTRKNLQSIALRGLYNGQQREIQLNNKLEDTQALSTLAHELGHAILQHDGHTGKSSAQIEMEADALGIMIQSHLGIEIEETRKRHLADHFRKYQKQYKELPGMDSFGVVLKNVFQEFKKIEPDLTEAIERYVPDLKPKPEVKKERLSRSEIYEEIKRSVRILDYAQEHGLVTRRVGRYYTISGHESVRIDPDKNCFWRNSGRGFNTSGSIIDFAMNFVHDGNAHEALKELQGKIQTERYVSPGNAREKMMKRPKEQTRTERPKLQETLPKAGENMRRVYAYLIKSRYLDQDIVQEFIDRKMLYQDVNGNCVFVAYDKNGEPNFATLRGTLTDKRFMGDVPGCDYSRDFYIANQADRMIVAESVIDAMSVMSILKGQGQDPKAYDYLIQAGTQKYEAILTHLGEHPMKEVLLSLDHDVAGVTAMGQIQTLLQEKQIETAVSIHVPSIENKDWNGELAYAAKRMMPMENISYLPKQQLPQIRYCAVQSTAQVEERGFRKRGEKHQYRLVEKKDGVISPMEINRNIIYTNPEDLKPLVPAMYVLVDYNKLDGMEKTENEIKGNEVPGEHTAKADRAEFAQGNETEHTEEKKEAAVSGLPVRKISIEDGMYMANVRIEGKEQELAIWKKDGNYLVETGYAYNGTLEEHLLDAAQVEAMLEEGVSIQADGLLISRMEASAETGELKKEKSEMNGFLDKLQKQELQKDQVKPIQPAIQQELSLGM